MRLGRCYCWLIVVALLAISASRYALPANAEVKVLSKDVDSKSAAADFCKSFQITDKQARQAFAHYHPITGKEMHDYYAYFSCWVHGTIRLTDGKTFRWKLNSGNLLETDYPDSRRKVLGGAYTDDPSGK